MQNRNAIPSVHTLFSSFIYLLRFKNLLTYLFQRQNNREEGKDRLLICMFILQMVQWLEVIQGGGQESGIPSASRMKMAEAWALRPLLLPSWGIGRELNEQQRSWDMNQHSYWMLVLQSVALPTVPQCWLLFNTSKFYTKKHSKWLHQKAKLK